jgi:hypothetical protein
VCWHVCVCVEFVLVDLSICWQLCVCVHSVCCMCWLIGLYVGMRVCKTVARSFCVNMYVYEFTKLFIFELFIPWHVYMWLQHYN